ncbi:hypothetical protein [Streptomyces hirsutus]|uniref:hypothetical protein n=1 Tax=Streptomyces hirsutus TaxID=35620 RepID=UPI0036668035
MDEPAEDVVALDPLRGEGDGVRFVGWGLIGSRFRPARAVAHAGTLPVVLLRAGRETPEIAATVEAFVTTAKDCGAHLELVDVPNGHHGFETLDPPEEIRPALHHAMRSVVTHLTS